MKRRLQRTGPLARVNLLRLTIFGVILIIAVLALTLHVGVFRYMLRGALVVGVILLFGSYLAEWWMKRIRNKTRR